MQKTSIKTRLEAIDYAIKWQKWVSEQNKIGLKPTLYQSDLVEWQVFFENLADKFDLREEFVENGIL